MKKEQIANGLALNSTQFNLSRILGPAIAGVLMSSVGTVGAFGVSALSYVPFILVAMWVLPKSAAMVGKTQGFDWGQLNTNVREVLHQPLLRGALSTVFTSSLLCAPVVVFCPVLVQESLHGDVSHFSLAVGAFGLGGLLGAIGLLGLSEKRDRRTISSGFAIAYAVVVMFASQSRSEWVLPLLFALAGYSMTMTMTNTTANTLLQSAASPAIRSSDVLSARLAWTRLHIRSPFARTGYVGSDGERMKRIPPSTSIPTRSSSRD